MTSSPLPKPLDLDIDPSTLILRELTPAEKIRCWRTNSVSWAGKLNCDDYVGRETVNGSGELGRDKSIRYWGFVAPSVGDRKGKEQKQVEGGEKEEEAIYAAVETLRKEVLVKRDGGTCSKEWSYGIASVFTPLKYRGRKIAAWMMRRLGEWFDGPEANCRFSVLYSDIGEYYSTLGWPSFPSLETSLPAITSTTIITSSSCLNTPTTPLTATLLPPLCDLDITTLKTTISTTPLPPGINTRLAFLPTYAQAAWHFGAEEFTASKLYTDPARMPSVKGAISRGGKTWGYWVHDYNEEKLSVLRLVSLGSEAVDKGAEEEQAVQELAAVLRAAQAEAAEWALKKVVLWNPDARAVAACRIVLGEDNEPVVRQRTEGSIPCLRWKGGAQARGQGQQSGDWENGIDWVALEKYSWC